ncbi:serotransferrin isoform X3 [Microcaecilia unicolor]|uniref:Serotransferrin isoform X3 n=1 Tax=Microcaecilia unicolor TaxID=1415580 RepID=A0A6P7Z4K9_9AMPH|nr:serotransferrin isoform X3 [Microcaecilia unicolor]
MNVSDYSASLCPYIRQESSSTPPQNSEGQVPEQRPAVAFSISPQKVGTMRFVLYTVLSFALLAFSPTVSQSADKNIRLCVKSDAEFQKCGEFKDATKNSQYSLSCVRKTNTDDCIQAIASDYADFMTMDGGDIYKAGLSPFDLKPIMTEDYGKGEESETCYYAVAVVKKGSNFKFSDLKGKKSCHTGFDKAAGWIIPVGLLQTKGILSWEGPSNEPIERAVARLFVASCVPGVTTEPNLCSLCKGSGTSRCSRSDNEPYYNYNGAFLCVHEGAGEVAFVKHTTVPDELAGMYELLCPDNTRKPVSEYVHCNLARVPAHAVMTRSKGENLKTEEIVSFLTMAQEKFGSGQDSKGKFSLFSSHFGKDLLFKDSTKKLKRLPSKMDTTLYLGTNYLDAIQALRREESSPANDKVRWCTVGNEEKKKCDRWSSLSGGAIDCIASDNTEEGMIKILKGEADAMAVDGGYLYTAGQCGLVPVLAEYYKEGYSKQWSPSDEAAMYYAVAIVKRTSDITWKNLKGKKSCHTAVGRNAGWTVPMGLICNQTQNNSFAQFFSQSCAPGADPSSSLCELCIGSGLKKPDSKCQPNTDEPYYGYSGTLRCLVEVGDVAFAKETTIFQNTDGKNPASWAQNLKSRDFMLLCPDGTRANAEEYLKCHLARVPSHAVISPADKRDMVVQIVMNQQNFFQSAPSTNAHNVSRSTAC